MPIFKKIKYLVIKRQATLSATILTLSIHVLICSALKDFLLASYRKWLDEIMTLILRRRHQVHVVPARSVSMSCWDWVAVTSPWRHSLPQWQHLQSKVSRRPPRCLAVASTMWTTVPTHHPTRSERPSHYQITPLSLIGLRQTNTIGQVYGRSLLKRVITTTHECAMVIFLDAFVCLYAYSDAHAGSNFCIRMPRNGNFFFWRASNVLNAAVDIAISSVCPSY